MLVEYRVRRLFLFREGAVDLLRGLFVHLAKRVSLRSFALFVKYIDTNDSHHLSQLIFVSLTTRQGFGFHQRWSPV